MIRGPGMRARLVLTLCATAAVTLTVAALALLPPLDHRLRTDAAHTLTLRAAAARPGLERLTVRGLHGARGRHLIHELARATGAQVVVIDPHGPVISTDPDEPFQDGAAVQALRTRRGSDSVHGGTARAALALRIAGRPYALALERRLGDVGRTYDV